MSERLTVWVDGCSNKNGSGWAVIIPSRKIIYRGDLHRHDRACEQPCRLQFTNQKAELSAIIQAVHRFGYNLHIITDSQYAMSCFTIWYQKWLTNGWIGSNRKPVENRPLIELGLQLGANNATFEHVNGHSGNVYNDMADYYSKYKILKSEHSDWTILHG